MVHVWCMYCVCMVYVWCMYGTCMVHVWCMYGAFLGFCMVQIVYCDDWDECYYYNHYCYYQLYYIMITITIMMITTTMINGSSLSTYWSNKLISNNITSTITISSSETIVHITAVSNAYIITIVIIGGSVVYEIIDIEVTGIIVAVDIIAIVIVHIMIYVIVICYSSKAIFDTCWTSLHFSEFFVFVKSSGQNSEYHKTVPYHNLLTKRREREREVIHA